MKFYQLTILLMCLCLVSCYSEKDKYLNKYQQFTTDIITNASTYTAEEWENAITVYNKLKNEYILYSRDMTIDERAYVEELNKTINKEIIRNAATETSDFLKDAIDEVSGLLDDLFEE